MGAIFARAAECGETCVNAICNWSLSSYRSSPLTVLRMTGSKSHMQKKLIPELVLTVPLMKPLVTPPEGNANAKKEATRLGAHAVGAMTKFHAGCGEK